MGRPERPILGNSPCAEFARDLRAIREHSGLTYREMAGKTHYCHTTLSSAASGKKVPTWEVTWAFLQACGVDESEKETWRDKWTVARREDKRLHYATTRTGRRGKRASRRFRKTTA